jgi:hypothetical protein
MTDRPLLIADIIEVRHGGRAIYPHKHMVALLTGGRVPKWRRVWRFVMRLIP